MTQITVDPEGIEIGDRVEVTEYYGDPTFQGDLPVRGTVVGFIEVDGYWEYEIEIDNDPGHFIHPFVNGTPMADGGFSHSVKKLVANRGRAVPADRCECGAVKIGCGKGSPGHSFWCPWV